MKTIFDSMLRLSAPILEGTLRGMETVLRAGESLVTRQPEDLDRSTSELANNLARSALRLTSRPESWRDAGHEMVDAVGRSLSEARLSDLLGAPLSWSTLAVQEARRTLAAARAMPLEKMPDFLEFVVETFLDLDVYFRLRYRDEIERWRQRVDDDPDDARARLELGRVLLKCGLFEDAAVELENVELENVAGRRGHRRRALYEALVARYRCGDFARAVEHGVACLDDDPSHARARFWLWLAARKQQGYPDSVPAEHRMEVRAGFDPSPVELEDVTARLGLDKVSGGRGTAIFDLDGDGHLDVVIAGAHAGCSLFRNRGDGTFSDISTGSGLDRCVYAFAIAAGDYDNDGRTDLYVTSLGFYDGWGRLMHNNGDGTFTDVTEEAGVKCWGPGFTAAWVDTNHNGHLDLFVANNLGGLFDRKSPNRLFRNNGDGTFTEVAAAASGLRTPWPTIGAAWGDFTNNGLPDLFLSNLGPAQLFRNNGDGTFSDISRRAGIDRPAIGSVALACDIDDDGWLDIVQMTYSRPDDAIHTLRHGHGPSDGSPMRIFRNNGDGEPSFTEIGRELGLTGCWGTMSAAAGDVSNNGHLDLWLGNGDPGMDRNEPAILLANDGHRFRNVSFAAGLPFTGKGHGVNLADLCGDGRLHLLVASGGIYPGDLRTTSVYRPKERPGHYLSVRLVGTESNRDAIGARLRLRAGGRDQHRLVSGGTNFGCLPCEQHFGLGRQESIDSLEVRWPSGRRQDFPDLPVNTRIRIVEGEDGWNE